MVRHNFVEKVGLTLLFPPTWYFIHSHLSIVLVSMARGRGKGFCILAIINKLPHQTEMGSLFKETLLFIEGFQRFFIIH